MANLQLALQAVAVHGQDDKACDGDEESWQQTSQVEYGCGLEGDS